MTPIVGFLPDGDPAMPGVILEADNILPTPRGYGNAFEPLAVTFVALPAATNGAAFVRTLVYATPKLYVGTTAGLYQYSALAWTDRSKVGGYAATSRWSFCQFGDATLAAATGHLIQQATTGSFADISGSPQAKYLVVSNGFVLALNTSTSTDQWACCALRDQSDWTPAAATQSANGRLLDTPGPIIGARELGDTVIAYKERSIYRMRYVNVPLIWASEVIDQNVGAVCNEAVIDIDTAHVFMGEHDFYYFDGTRPVSIGEGIREWFFNRLLWRERDKVRGGFDRQRMLAYWWYPVVVPGSTTGTVKQAIVYSVKTRRWGHVSGHEVQEAIPYTLESGGLSFTPETLHVVEDGILCNLVNPSQSSTIRFGWMGDDVISSTLTKIRPRFTSFFSGNPALTAEFYKTDYLYNSVIGPTAIPIGTANWKEGAFGTQQNAHWHSAKLTIPGSFEMTAIGNDLPRPAGKR